MMGSTIQYRVSNTMGDVVFDEASVEKHAIMDHVAISEWQLGIIYECCVSRSDLVYLHVCTVAVIGLHVRPIF